MKRVLFASLFVIMTSVQAVNVRVHDVNGLYQMINIPLDGHSFQHHLQNAGVQLGNSQELWVMIEGEPDNFIPLDTPVNDVIQDGDVVVIHIVPSDDDNDQIDPQVLQIIQNLLNQLNFEDEGLGRELPAPIIEDVD